MRTKIKAMKNRSLLLLCFTLIFFVFSFNGQAQVPVIDGIIDTYWDTISVQKLTMTNVGNDISDEADLSGDYRLSWNDTSLFVLIEVNDEKLFIDDTTFNGDNLSAHMQDHLEFYLDIKNRKSENYGSEQFMWLIKPGIDTLLSGRMGEDTTNAPSILYSSSVIENTGYIYEMEIPVDSVPGMTPLDTGNILGFEIRIIDNDTGDAETIDQLSTNNQSLQKYLDPYELNTLMLKDNGSCEIMDSIVLDGIIDGGWKDAPVFYITIPVDNYIGREYTVDDENDCSGYFRVRWDEHNLYILGVVKDDNFSLFHESGHQRDNFGVYMDYLNKKGDLFEDGVIGAWKVGYSNQNNPNKWTPKGLSLGYSINEEEGYYISESKVPNEANGLVPFYIGQFLGLDVKINDCDFDGNVLTRDQLGWEDEYDLIWREPSRFGSVELLEGGNVKAYNDAPEPPVLMGLLRDTFDVHLMWDPVEKAVEYLILKDGVKTDTIDSGNTNYVFEDLNYGFYSFSAVSIGEGNLRSEFSNPYDIEVLEIEDPNVSIPKHQSGEKSGNIRIYPVPADQRLFIEAEGIMAVDIYDITGKKVVSRKTNHLEYGTTEFDISNLQKGIYIISVKTPKDYINSKFIKN